MKATSFEITRVDYIKDSQSYRAKFKYFGENDEMIGEDGHEVMVRLKVDTPMEDKVRAIHREITKTINGYSTQKEIEKIVKNKRVPLNGIKDEKTTG